MTADVMLLGLFFGLSLFFIAIAVAEGIHKKDRLWPLIYLALGILNAMMFFDTFLNLAQYS